MTITTTMRMAIIDHDHNMRAAYVHVAGRRGDVAARHRRAGGGLVLRYCACSIPLVGVIGAVVIASWAYGLIRDSGMVLLDAEDNPALAGEIRGMIEGEMDARVADLHLWRLGPGHRGLIVSLVCPDQSTAARVRETLRERYPDLSHVTVEVAVCADCT